MGGLLILFLLLGREISTLVQSMSVFVSAGWVLLSNDGVR
jgi:hypothetical protein